MSEGIDVAIRGGQPTEADGSFQTRVIGRAGAVLVATPSLLQAYGRPLQPTDLSRLPTIGVAEGLGPDKWELVDDAGRCIHGGGPSMPWSMRLRLLTTRRWWRRVFWGVR